MKIDARRLRRLPPADLRRRLRRCSWVQLVKWATRYMTRFGYDENRIDDVQKAYKDELIEFVIDAIYDP